jgi:hypothetical protein
MAKLLLLLRAVPGESLYEALAEGLQVEFGGDGGLTVQLMEALANDPFYEPRAHLSRPDSVLEVVTRAGIPLASTTSALRRLAKELPLAQDSLALAVQHRRYIGAPPQRVHYHQLMFPKAGWCRADYMDYYTRFHCRMGFNTPGIAGYIQNYIDSRASRELADALGIETVPAWSISELTMEDPGAMLSDPGVGEVANAAAVDEERFLDRDRNVAFCSEVTLRLGDFDAVNEPAFEQYFGG